MPARGAAVIAVTSLGRDRGGSGTHRGSSGTPQHGPCVNCKTIKGKYGKLLTFFVYGGLFITAVGGFMALGGVRNKQAVLTVVAILAACCGLSMMISTFCVYKQLEERKGQPSTPSILLGCQQFNIDNNADVYQVLAVSFGILMLFLGGIPLGLGIRFAFLSAIIAGALSCGTGVFVIIVARIAREHHRKTSSGANSGTKTTTRQISPTNENANTSSSTGDLADTSDPTSYGISRRTQSTQSLSRSLVSLEQAGYTVPRNYRPAHYIVSADYNSHGYQIPSSISAPSYDVPSGYLPPPDTQPPSYDSVSGYSAPPEISPPSYEASTGYRAPTQPLMPMYHHPFDSGLPDHPPPSYTNSTHTGAPY